MTIPTAEELSRSPAFQGLVSIGSGVMQAHAAVIREMDADALHVHQAAAEDVRVQLSALMRDRAEISERELSRLAELAGLSPASIRTIAERVHTLGTALNEAFPELQSLEARTKILLVTDALRRDEASMAVIKRVAVEAADDDAYNVCKSKCLIEFLLAILDAQITAINRMMSCFVLVFPPLVMLCASIMIAIMIYEMDKANDEYTECVEACQGADDPAPDQG